MNWGKVPAYLRPIEKRDDLGLMFMHRWSPVMRELWRARIEMGRVELYRADNIDWSADESEWIMVRSGQ